jgi:hypothetical protein
MAHLIAVRSLGVLLTATALIWKNWAPRSDVTGASPTSLSISDIVLKVARGQVADHP